MLTALLLLVGGQGASRACQMHHMLSAVAGSHDAHDSREPHGSNASNHNDLHNSAHGDHDTASSESQNDSPADAHEGCHCLGKCTGAVAVVVTDTATAQIPVPAIIARLRVVAVTDVNAAVLKAYYQLPFSTAPPKFA